MEICLGAALRRQDRTEEREIGRTLAMHIPIRNEL
jgi:hypothetical protein